MKLIMHNWHCISHGNDFKGKHLFIGFYKMYDAEGCDRVTIKEGTVKNRTG